MSGGRAKIPASVLTVCIAVVGALIVPGVATARGGLHLRLSPLAGLRDGQSVDYEVTGQALRPGRVLEVWQCDAAAELDMGSPLTELNRWCIPLDGRTVPDPGGSVTGTVTVREVFTTYPPDEPPDAVHCGDRPHDCTLVAVMRADDPEGRIRALDVRSIGMLPSPVAVGGPGLQGEDGSVEVWVSGDRRAKVTLAQCVRFPGVPRDLQRCRPGPELRLSRSGRAHVEMEVVPTLEVDGRTWDCRTRPCQVTLFDRAGRILGAADIPGSVHYVDVRVEPDTDLTHGQVIQGRFESAARDVTYYIAICLASVLEGRPTAESCYVYFPLPGPGVHVLDLPAYETFTPFGGGPEVSCGYEPGACIIGVGTDLVAAGYAPLTFAAPSPPPVGEI